MHFCLLSLTTAAFAALVAAAPTSSSHVLHEKRDVPARKWVKRSRLVGSGEGLERKILPMRIGLRQSNLQRGDELLMEV